MGEPAVMHDHGVAIPEIDGRQIAGKNLLDFGVFGAAPCGVFAFGCVVEQGVESWI